MAVTPGEEMFDRLREVLYEERVTEAELRSLTERADALVRVSSAQVEASERRLDVLSEDASSPLSEVYKVHCSDGCEDRVAFPIPR